jgi:hypothetical protein
MFEYFYNEILRKTVISFGSLFNEISIKKIDNSGNVSSVTKVPLAYGPTQKFLARLEQQPDLNKSTQITLPRMSFELTGISYDSSRKVTTTQTFLSKPLSDGTQAKKMYMPVPYNVQFELSIMTQFNDDMLQIVEQILPYFQPQYSLTVDLIESIGEKRDIPVILDGISMNDDYEGDFNKRRALVYTLSFTAKTYIFGPIADGTKDIIKKVSMGFVAGGETKERRRDLTYTVEPKATKSYSETNTTTIIDDLLISEGKVSVENATGITENSYITINEETLKIKEVDGNILYVERGAYGTPILDHVSGSGVKLITESDNDLIEFGDDFGFSGGFS